MLWGCFGGLGFGIVYHPSGPSFDTLLVGRTLSPDAAFLNYTRHYAALGAGAGPAVFKQHLVLTAPGDWRPIAGIAVSNSKADWQPFADAATPVTSPAQPGIKQAGLNGMLAPNLRSVVNNGRAVPTHRYLQV